MYYDCDDPYSLRDSIQTMREMGFVSVYRRDRPDLMPPKEQGRNEKCSCGSGKKYKNCCGRRV
jgi:uncharacterized protein YecA (UPF0149 family)